MSKFPDIYSKKGNELAVRPSSDWFLPDFFSDEDDPAFTAHIAHLAASFGSEQVSPEDLGKAANIVYKTALYTNNFCMPVSYKNQLVSVKFITGHLWEGKIAGPSPAKVMVLSKTPGGEDSDKGRNFISQSGLLLQQQFADIGVNVSEWYITNLVRFATPPNFSGALPKPWIKMCRRLLRAELAIVQPDFILCLGGEVAKELFNTSVDRAYGNVFDYTFPVWDGKELLNKTAKAIVSIHPSALSKKADKLNQFQLSLRQFKDLVETGKSVIEETGLNYYTINSEYELNSLVDSILAAGKPKMVAFDAEWYGRRPEDSKSFLRCYQFSWKAKHAAVVVFRNSKGEPTFQGDPYKPLARLFIESGARPVGHNIKADVMWLGRGLKEAGYDIEANLYPPQHGLDLGPPATRTEGAFDTMLAAHAIRETGPFELEALGVLYLGVPRWDNTVKLTHDNKVPFGYMPDEVLYPYACLHKGSLVQLADGSWRPIKSLVDQKYSGKVKALQNGKVVNATVTGWHKAAVGQKEWRRLLLASSKRGKHGLLGPVFTPDHEVLTQRGKVRVDEIVPGVDKIITSCPEFSSEQLSIFLGCLLGDGGLKKKGSQPGVAFAFGQVKRRGDYLRWKAKAFENQRPCEHFYGDYDQFVTPCNAYITHLADRFDTKPSTEHKHKKAVITTELLCNLGDLGLAVWYQDDGSLVGSRDKGFSSRIYCKISDEEQSLVISWLTDKFGAGISYKKSGRFIQFTGQAHFNFHAVVSKFMHPCMQYKTQLPVKKAPIIPQGSRLFAETIEDVVNWTPPKVSRGHGVRYCLSVKGAENFLTKAGFVSNCKDADVTFRLAELFNGEWSGNNPENCIRPGYLDSDPVFQLDSRRHFWISMMALSSFMEMEQRGILFDAHQCTKLREVFLQARDRVLSELQAELNWPLFNPNSVNHKREFLFGEKLNGKKPDENGEIPRIRPKGALSLYLTPLKTSGKPAIPWSKVVEDKKEEQYSPSTAKDTMGVFAHTTPLVKKLMDYSFVNQALNTALRAPSEGNFLALDTPDEADGTESEDVEEVSQKGLMDYVCEDNAIHSIYWQTKETGRASASKPNLMAISKKRDKDYARIVGPQFRPIRSLFIARPGYLLVEGDFIGAELAMMAMLSGDETMIDHVRRSGLPDDHPDHFDIHSNFASTIFKLGLPPRKSALEAAGKKSLRDAVKTIVFGIPYGRGMEAVVVAVKEESGLEISVKDAENIRDGIFETYPKLREFLERTKNRVVKPGYLRDNFGGLRRFTLLGDDRKSAEDAKREAGNFRIQGSVARAMSLGLYNLRAYRRHVEPQLDYYILNQIHDAAISECAIPHVERFVDHVLPTCLSKAVKFYAVDDDGKRVSDRLFSFDLDIHVYERWGIDLTHDDCDRLGISRKFGKAPKPKK